MFVKQSFSIFLLSMLAACGGGGSSSSGDAPVTPPQQPEVPEPAPERDGQAPQAEIVFPWQKSAAVGSVVTVRGTATDDSGVASVRVNGKDAVISVMRTAGVGVNKTSDGSGKDVEWQVELELPGGESEIVVEVTDATGEHSATADTAEVQFYKVPTTFSFDVANQRLVGIADGSVLDYRFATDTQQTFADLDYPFTDCFDPATDQMYYAELIDDSTYRFNAVSLSGSAVPYTIHAQRRSVDVPEYTTKLYCDIANKSLYFVVHRSLHSDYIDSSTIYKISLEPTPTWSVLFETSSDNPVVVGLDTLAVSDGALIAHTMNSDDIVAISTQDGSVEILYENYPKFGAIMATGSTRETVYAVHYNGVDVIDTTSGKFDAKGYASEGQPLAFSQLRAAAFDGANNRVLVGDSDLESIIAVDLVTGERSMALTSGIGEGPKMIEADDLVVNSAKTKAYVVDSAGNVAEKVVEIDLETGDRRTFGNINSPFNVRAGGIVLDETNGFVYAATSSAVFKINIDTSETEQLASAGEGTSSGFRHVSALELDPGRDRLLIADAVTEAIFSMDLETYEIDVASQGGKRGSGDPFGNINGLALDQERGSLYVTNQLDGTVQRVSLESGDRETLPIQCVGFGDDESLMGIAYNAFADELLVLDERATVIDLTDYGCSYDPRGYTVLRGFAPISESLAFGLESGSLVLIDLPSFEQVVVSK